jgi:hypothetical protein
MVLGLCFVEISSRTQELFESCFQSLADGAVKKKMAASLCLTPNHPSLIISVYLSCSHLRPIPTLSDSPLKNNVLSHGASAAEWDTINSINSEWPKGTVA